MGRGALVRLAFVENGVCTACHLKADTHDTISCYINKHFN